MAAKKQSPKAKKKRSIRTTDPAQSARFLEAAKNLGVDESGEAFAQALSAVLPTTRKKKSGD